MAEVLFVGCSELYRDALPTDVGAIWAARPFDAECEAATPDVIVIGGSAEKPAFTAQVLARRHKGTPLVIAARKGELVEITNLLKVTPFIPVGIQIVEEDRRVLSEAIAAALLRSRLRLSRSRAEERARDVLSTSGERRAPASVSAASLPRVRADLAGFFHYYDRHRKELADAVLPSAEKTPELPSLAIILGLDRHAVEGDNLAELERRAVVDDDWEPYLRRLRARGSRYAELGLPLGSWRAHLSSFRATLLNAFLSETHGDRSELLLVVLGMDRFIDVTMAAIDEGYANAHTVLASAFEARERLFTSVVESSEDAIFSQSLDGTITSWNPAAERLFGVSAEEAHGASIEGIVLHDAPEHPCRTIKTDRGHSPKSLEVVCRNRRNEVLSLSLSVSPLRGLDAVVVGSATIARDIGPRVRAVRALEQRSVELAKLEARKRAMLDGALDAIVTIDHLGSVLEYNPAAEAMFGYTAEQATGKKLAELIIPESLREAHRSGLERHIQTGESRVLGERREMPACRKNGEQFPAELSIVKLKDQEPPLYTGFIRDLTTLKRAQTALELSVEELSRSNRDLEHFAYVASHDLQEPLRMVTAYMELLVEKYEGQLDADAQLFIHYAVTGAQRMKRLIDDLLAYSRVDARGSRFEWCESENIVQTVLDGLSLSIKESGARIEYHELPRIFCDASQLEQVFSNLVSNAIKFGGQDVPQIRIGAERLADAWRFVVEDNGIGFDPAQAERIFQMFQRLHEVDRYEGTGVGLAIVRRIVERHGGHAFAEPRPGSGSRFYFTLPIHPVRSPAARNNNSD